MRPAWPVAEVRAAERAAATHLPPGTLMARAGAGIATAALNLLGGGYGRRVLALVGGGDNGGDALVAAALLARRGVRVDAVFAGRSDPALLAAFTAAGGRTGWPGATPDLVLDGLVGIGGSGGLREPAAELLDRAGRCATTVLAIDVPSGMAPDTGSGTVLAATRTVTPGCRKPGLLVDPDAGEVEVVGIGLDAHLPPPRVAALDAADVGRLLPAPGPGASKYTRGVLGLIAGSPGYGGAAVLAAGGALRGAAGYLRFVGVAAPAAAVRSAHPEAVVTQIEPGDAEAALRAGRVQAWALGPGMGTGPDTAALLAAVLATDIPVLIDADALSVLAERLLPDRADVLRRRGAATLLTPHEGEFARLATAAGIGVEARQDRIGAARAVAAAVGATVLLKGARTVIAQPDGLARVIDAGTGWLATAGSGDVLTGICGSLLAGGLDPLAAGAAGAWLHAAAARIAGGPLVPPDLVAALPAAWRLATAGPAGPGAPAAPGMP